MVPQPSWFDNMQVTRPLVLLKNFKKKSEPQVLELRFLHNWVQPRKNIFIWNRFIDLEKGYSQRGSKLIKDSEDS